MHGRSLAVYPTRVSLCNEGGVNGCAPRSSISVLTFARWCIGWLLRRRNDIGLSGCNLFNLEVDADFPNMASARLQIARLRSPCRDGGGQGRARKRSYDIIW